MSAVEPKTSVDKMAAKDAKGGGASTSGKKAQAGNKQRQATAPTTPNTAVKSLGQPPGAPVAPGTPELLNEKHALLKKSLSSANACGVDCSKPSQGAMKPSSGFLSNLLGRGRKTHSSLLPESPGVPSFPQAGAGGGGADNIHRASSSKSTIGPPAVSNEPFDWLARPEHLNDDRTQLRVISQLRRLSEFNSRLSTASNTILRVSPVIRLALDVTPFRTEDEASSALAAAGTAPVAALKKDTLVQLVRCNSNSTHFAVRKFDPSAAAAASVAVSAAGDSSVDSQSRTASPKSAPAPAPAHEPPATDIVWLSAADLGFRDEDVSAFLNLQIVTANTCSSAVSVGASDSPLPTQNTPAPQKKGGLFARLKKTSIGKADKQPGGKPAAGSPSPAPSPLVPRSSVTGPGPADHLDGGAGPVTIVEDGTPLCFEAPLFASATLAPRSTVVLTCKLAVAQAMTTSAVSFKSQPTSASPAPTGRPFVFWTGPQGAPVRAQLRSGLPHPSGGGNPQPAPASEITQHVGEDGFHSLQVRIDSNFRRFRATRNMFRIPSRAMARRV